MNNSPKNAKSIWDKLSEWWIKGIEDDESSEYVQIIVPLLEGILTQKKTILDVGTGTGRMAQEAEKSHGACNNSRRRYLHKAITPCQRSNYRYSICAAQH